MLPNWVKSSGKSRSKRLGKAGRNIGSSEERGAFSRNATKTWVEGGDLPSVCRAAPLSSLVPKRLVIDTVEGI